MEGRRWIPVSSLGCNEILGEPLLLYIFIVFFQIYYHIIIIIQGFRVIIIMSNKMR